MLHIQELLNRLYRKHGYNIIMEIKYNDDLLTKNKLFNEADVMNGLFLSGLWRYWKNMVH